MSKPLAIDLFCGLGGWTEGLLAEGYDVVGFDIEQHVYGDQRYPAQLVLQDVLTIHGKQFKDASLIVASPPCQEFSYMAMPWSRAKAIAAALRGEGEFPEGYTGSRTLQDLTALFDACFRIQCEAIEAAGHFIPLVVENVRGACAWVERSRWNYGSFHLWGDVPALMPLTVGGIKAPGMNWSDQTKRGQDFTRIAGQHAKVSRVCDCGHSESNHDAGRESPCTKCSCINPVYLSGFKTTGHVNKRDGHSHTRHLTNQAESGAVKNGGDWFGSGEDCSLMRKAASGSNARKAASAAIAKIPLPLSRHIASVYKPRQAMAI